MNHLLQARLINGNLTCLQHLDLFFVNIQATDFITHVGKTGARYQADIAGAYYSDIMH